MMFTTHLTWVRTQTTLTVAEVTALEEDNQKRIAELAEVHVARILKAVKKSFVSTLASAVLLY